MSSTSVNTLADVSGELLILDEINFNVQGGATPAIVGASDSGKSTFLGLLAVLDTPVGRHRYLHTR